jgi:sulfoacetaldehyde dehydrogenase
MQLEKPTSGPIFDVVQRARAAQAVVDSYDQARVDELVDAAAWAIIEPTRNQSLAERAVADTGIGNVADKVRKNYRKTLGLLRDLKGAKSVGVIARDPQNGITEIARPVGVVCAITPSTNPGATPANKIINAIKGRNAVIVAPSPKGLGTAIQLVGYIHAQFDRIGAPRDLVQVLPAPINKQATADLMALVDLVVATGSQANVRSAYTSGTPAFGVGAGNVAGIVDETADIEATADRIVRSKTFDNATSCSSENSVVVVASAREKLLASLEKRGAYLLDAEQTDRLQALMWPNGKLSGDVTGKSAATIAALAGFAELVEREPKILLVEQSADSVGPDFPYSGEKLSPVLTFYTVPDFDACASLVARIYQWQGAGHSVGLHTTRPERAMQLGLTLPVSRVIVSQAHCLAVGGSFDNGLPFSLSMGCGTWGGNNFSENMNYKHYLNITRIAEPIPEVVPTENDLLSTYFKKYGAH